MQQANRAAKAVSVERKESKDKRQKSRLKDRAFKEIDTVMEALGVLSIEPQPSESLLKSPLVAGSHSLSNTSLASSEGRLTHPMPSLSSASFQNTPSDIPQTVSR
jgi:hypothetical protein